MLPLVLACATPDDSADPLDGLVLVEEDVADVPIAGLDAGWMDRFREGDVAFEALFRESQGLGPAYIRGACAGCHADDGSGPGQVTKMVVLDGDAPAADQSLLPWGHTERPYVAGGAVTPLLAPDDPRVFATIRRPPAVFARGYLEAVDDAAIEAVAAAQAAQGEVSGRVNRVCWAFAEASDAFHSFAPDDCGLVGRFGLKARLPSLDGFAADAYQGDMAITSPYRPDELANPDGLADDALPGVDLPRETVERTADYMRLLALPGPPAPEGGGSSPEGDDAAPEGAGLFADVGCATCHVPTLPTRADHPVPQLAGIAAPIYTDLLVHDMGAAFSDGLTDGEAGPSEWRTAPLIGLRFQRTLLHDGRAASVEAAIEAHGEPDSEARASAERFAALTDADRAALLTFVEAL